MYVAVYRISNYYYYYYDYDTYYYYDYGYYYYRVYDYYGGYDEDAIVDAIAYAFYEDECYDFYYDYYYFEYYCSYYSDAVTTFGALLALYTIIIPLIFCVTIGVLIYCIAAKKCCFASNHSRTTVIRRPAPTPPPKVEPPKEITVNIQQEAPQMQYQPMMAQVRDEVTL